MKNLDKNQDKRLDNLQPIPFTKDNQPSPEAKSKGWERKREKLKIMNLITELGDMKYSEIKKMSKDIIAHPEKYTLNQVRVIKYVLNDKLFIDWLDRNISKAPIETDITSAGEKIEGVIVKFVESDNK
jgi:hypothetical protein